jgi:hypothetical protein
MLLLESEMFGVWIQSRRCGLVVCSLLSKTRKGVVLAKPTATLTGARRKLRLCEVVGHAVGIYFGGEGKKVQRRLLMTSDYIYLLP